VCLSALVVTGPPLRLGAGPLWSHLAGWEDLLVPVPATDGSGLDLEDGWPDRWLVKRQVSGARVSCTVRDLARMPGTGGPVRWFSWQREQGHRPGLQYLVSTGRHHGAESMEEARVLLALDFAGDLVDVVSQPLLLRFTTGSGKRSGRSTARTRPSPATGSWAGPGGSGSARAAAGRRITGFERYTVQTEGIARAALVLVLAHFEHGCMTSLKSGDQAVRWTAGSGPIPSVIGP